MDNAQKVKTFLEERFLVNFGEEITEDTDLFKAGIIESKGYMGIIKFLQDELNIEMTDEDLFMNVFASLSNIVDFVEKKQG
ncbi:acyl carrier protein [Paenibacillus sp. HN-1]|uniref:acyl carrier protein n=1 Tax=Paenibacillus TaxID=44249 RepID=UPI001CA899E9|nr:MULTISPECIES: phosphopantetheine-binding protein [Paenibacillus]MBY9081330.1 acyl carrier protein [Paenibacillus sp. CGMCC 1.18879]MBY9086485.1 acyl carrier protein [Paenibacillus sinensis]